MEAHPGRDKGLQLCMALRGPALEDGPVLSTKQITRGASRDIYKMAGTYTYVYQQQQLDMELRLQEPTPQKSGRAVGPATRPAPAPKKQVDRPSASTDVQAPPAEPERLLVLVQLSVHTASLTLLLLTSIPADEAAVQAREAAAKAAEHQVWVCVEAGWH
eukprot:970231-Pelagomonas_calceolata.AAC.1